MFETMTDIRRRYRPAATTLAAMMAVAVLMGAAAAAMILPGIGAVFSPAFVREVATAALIGAGVLLLSAAVYLKFGPVRRLCAQDAELAQWGTLTDDVLRTVPEGFFLVDADFVIRDPVSPNVLKLLKHKLWPGMDLIEFLRPILPPETLDATRHYLKQLFSPTGRAHRIATRNPLAEIVFGGPSSKQVPLGFRFERMERDGAARYLLVVVSDISERMRVDKELAGAKLRLRAQIEGVIRVLGHDRVQVRACLDRNEATLDELRRRLLRLSAASEADAREALLYALVADAQTLKSDAGAIDLDVIETPAHSLELDLVELLGHDEFSYEDGRRLAAHAQHLAERIGTMRELLTQVDRRPAATGATAALAIVRSQEPASSKSSTVASLEQRAAANVATSHFPAPSLSAEVSAPARVRAEASEAMPKPASWAASVRPDPAQIEASSLPRVAIAGSAQASSDSLKANQPSHREPAVPAAAPHGSDTQVGAGGRHLSGVISIGGNAAAIAGGPERAAAFVARMQTRLPARVDTSAPPLAHPAPPPVPSPVQTSREQPLEQRAQATRESSTSARAAPAVASARTTSTATTVASSRAQSIAHAWPATRADIRPMAENPVASSLKAAAGPLFEGAKAQATTAPTTKVQPAPAVNAAVASVDAAAPSADEPAIDRSGNLIPRPRLVASDGVADESALSSKASENGRTSSNECRAEDPFSFLPLLALSGDGAAALPSSKAAMIAWATYARRLAGEQGKSLRVEAQLELFEQLPAATVAILREVGSELVGNAVVHGIESMSMRRRVGKDAVGVVRITLSCDAEGIWQFSARDDGRGINLMRVRSALLRTGRYLPDAIGKMSERDVIRKIFESGVTTAAISDVSGGVGLGLPRVMERIGQLGARMSMTTAPGKHTEFRIRWSQQ
jgi:chemotaxis protein histidine kinase CheA